MKNIFFLVCITVGISLRSQELYSFAEPASNLPAYAMSLKNASTFQRDVHSDRITQRHLPELRAGLNKSWTLSVASGFSDMHQRNLIWEGAKLYAKYRFLANDEVHKHFRMAAFGAATYSRNHLDRNEINIGMMEQSGVQAGLIATQLWNKFAVSATGSWNEVLNNERWDKAYLDRYAGRAVNYSLSAGYLLLPAQYRDYNQTNINLYAELLGSRNFAFATETYYVDLAPSVQAIFKSTAKLNVGYRFELSSDIYRPAKNSWLVSVEYLFLNALKKRP